MRALVLALCVACIPVAAETPEAAQGEVVSFTRGQLEQFLRQLEGMVSKREAAAFQAGREDAKGQCRSLPSAQSQSVAIPCSHSPIGVPILSAGKGKSF